MNINRITGGLILLLFLLSLSCSGIGSSKNVDVEYVKKRINVTVKDDGNNPVKNATITMSKKNWPVVKKTTNQYGATTFYEIYTLPFELNIQHGKAYIPKAVSITESDFPYNKRSADIAVTLERRKTVIVGRVIDEETGQPIPNVVTVSAYPYFDISNVETTWKDGTYRIASSELEKGDEVEIKANIRGYNENFRKITITNYLGINKVPDISLTPNPIEDPMPPDTGKIIIPPTGTITITIN